MSRSRARKPVEIRLNDDGTLDEVVGHNVDVVHLEDMGSGWFLSIGDVAVWLGAKGRVRANYETRGAELVVKNHAMPREKRCSCADCIKHDNTLPYYEPAPQKRRKR